MRRLHVVALAAAVVLAPFGAAIQVPHAAAKGPAPIDARSVWNPSAAALAALRSLPPARETREALVAIMARHGATPQAVAFTGRLQGSPAYLISLDETFLEEFRVGVIWHPFRQHSQKGFVMVNGHPGVVDVSNVKLLQGIRLDPAETLKTLATTPDKLRCAWAQPLSYEVGPGVIRAGTSVEVLYPIAATASGASVGTVHVFFNFAFPHWEFFGTSFDFIEKATPPRSHGPSDSKANTQVGFKLRPQRPQIR